MADASDVSWYTLVVSSAVIGALISSCVNALVVFFTKRAERQRDEAKEAQRVNHAYLEIVLQLEAFAKSGTDLLFEIDAWFDEQQRYGEGASAIPGRKALTLELDPSPVWGELPIPFVERLKILPLQLASTNDWISSAFDYWAGLEEGYAFEQQRIAFYGIKVCGIAGRVRKKLKLESSPEAADYVFRFHAIVDERRDLFVKHGESSVLIPVLREQYQNEEAMKRSFVLRLRAWYRRRRRPWFEGI